MKVMEIRIVLLGIYCVLGTLRAGENRPPLKIGDPAPAFQLRDDEGKWRSLEEFRGKKVVLYFYPKNDTPGCTKEACNFRDNYELYRKHDIEVIGISYDSPESHRRFKEKYQLPFILLSDSHKQVAKAYGAYGGVMKFFMPRRMTFLIDEEGNIVHVFEKVDVSTHALEVLKAFGINPENSGE